MVETENKKIETDRSTADRETELSETNVIYKKLQSRACASNGQVTCCQSY